MSVKPLEELRVRMNSNWPVWLVVAVVALQPIGRLPEIPILIMALFGVKELIVNRSNVFSSRSFQWFTALFLCFWLPAVFSLPDAVNFHKGLSTTLGMLRFYLAGVFIIFRLGAIDAHRWIATAVAIILSFWALDGIVELLWGRDLFGLSSGSSLYITGVYGDNKRLGYALIAFLGIGLASVRSGLPIVWRVAFLSLMLFVIFISGTRMAWLASVWFTVIVFFVFWRSGVQLPKKWVVGGVLGLVLMGGISAQAPSVQLKLSKSVAAFSGGSFDKASSGRISIWTTSLDMFSDNWLNGVGVRGFRYTYADYAAVDDRFVHGQAEKLGAYHPHQIVLEMLAEMGIIGLVGLLTAFSIIVSLLLKVVHHTTSYSFLYFAGIATLLMPLNTHLSMYSSYWASLFWFLAALAFSIWRVEFESHENT